MYGDLVFADQEFGGGRGKRWKVDWDKTHQPIQIKLKCLRSVRDKLPRMSFMTPLFIVFAVPFYLLADNLDP